MIHKPQNIRPILFCLFATILSAIIGISLIAFSYKIDTKPSKPQIFTSSLLLLQEQEIHPRYNTTFPGSKIDNFSTSLMLNISSFSDSSSPLIYATTNPRTEYHRKNMPSNLFYSSFYKTPHGSYIVGYPRYWHGYTILLRPLINFLNLQQLRLLNAVLQNILLIITLFYLYKHLSPNIALSFLFTVFYLNPITLAKCLPYSSLYYIIMLSIIALIKTSIKPYKIFLFSGILTSYFDMLTAPLITLGIPLVVLCLKNKTTPKQDMLSLFYCSIAYCFGLSFMILLKWLITAYFTTPDIIKETFNSLIWRINGNGFIESGIHDFSFLNALKRNFYELKSHTSLFVLLIFLILQNLIFLTKKQLTPNKDYRLILLLLISTLPFMWYAIFINHSIVHPLMSYRVLGIFIFSLSSFLSSLLTSHNKSST